MQLPALSHGILIRRYKRFLADVLLPNGEQITLHCPNTGAMTGCATEDDRVWFSTSSNLKRKYAHTWELTETARGDIICINTQRANTLVGEALAHNVIAELANYPNQQAEVKYGTENSRVDFLLSGAGLPDCFVEVKSTTLLSENGLGMFPDAKTERGQKHLRELAQIVEGGQKAVIFFAVLHTGITHFDVARAIDPKYAALFDEALKKGVQPLVYKMAVRKENGVPVALGLVEPLARACG